MNSGLESVVEGAVCRWADMNGIRHLKLNGSGNRSYPDRLFFIPGGRPVLIEFKKQGKEPEPLQGFVIEALREINYEVYWTDDKDEAIGWLRVAAQKVHATGRGVVARTKRGRSVSKTGS